MKDKIIIMLTHNDVTVSNAKEVFEENKDLPIKNWGFKDVGLKPDQMKELCQLMKASGATTFLEVVTYTEQECLNGARLAHACGFDYLMGTIFYDSVAEYAAEKGLKYIPFVGTVHGSPSILEGTAEEMVSQAELYKSKGAYGTDLLGYRYLQGNPEELSKEFIAKSPIPTVLAGSIGSKERLDIVKDMDPWLFTMGSALFTKNFVKDGTFRDNLKVVCDYIANK